jgi:NAD-dependent deacetylase
MHAPIVILTGAGISQESGISTFRDQNGLWENNRVEDVASPEGFRRDPILVHRFYNLRRRQGQEVKPNAAHHALARLEAAWKGAFLLISQNVDDLHHRAGSKRLIPMHGALNEARCEACGWEGRWLKDLGKENACIACRQAGFLRPRIVWFGEMPVGLEEAIEALSRCRIFLSIGTSGHVYPAAGFVSCLSPGARAIECNTMETAISPAFSEHRRGPATVVVPALVAELLEER